MTVSSSPEPTTPSNGTSVAAGKPFWPHRLLIVGVVVLYLAGISPWWNTASDSATYLMAGKNVAEGRGYTLHGEPNAFVPPGFPLIIAGLTWVGLGDMLYLNAAMTAMALVMMFTIFGLLRCLVPEQEEYALRLTLENPNGSPAGEVRLRAWRYDLGFACALASMVMFDMYELVSRQYSDIPCMILGFLGLWCYCLGVKGRPGLLWVGTIALAGMSWFRVAAMPLAAGAAVGLLLEPRKVSRRVVIFHAAFLVAALAATLAVFYLWHQYAVEQGPIPQETYTGELDRFRVFDRTVFEWLAGPFINTWETSVPLCRVFTGQNNIPNVVCILLFACPILLGMWVRWRQRQYLPLLATVAYLGVILLMRSMKERYLLPVTPLLVLYYADGVRWLIELRPNSRIVAKFTVICLLAAFTIIGVHKDLRYAARRHDPTIQEQNREPLEAAAAALKAHHREGEWFTTKWGECLSYRSGVPYRNLYGKFGRYKTLPPEEMLQLLDELNVTLVVERMRIEPLPYCEVMIDAVKHSPRYKLVFENSDYRIYRRLPDPAPGKQRSPKPKSPAAG